MPFVARPCGAAIHFTVRGSGPIPVLLLAPGGMRSHEGQWDSQREQEDEEEERERRKKKTNKLGALEPHEKFLS